MSVVFIFSRRACRPSRCSWDSKNLRSAFVTRARYSAGAGGINLKPRRVGGLTKARALRDAAQGLRMTFTVDDTWGGALTTAQNAQLAASCSAETLTAATCFADWIEPLVSTVPPRKVPGRGVASSSPGLGVSVDVDMLGSAVRQP